MAQVTFQNLGILDAIAPGETKHRWWNNAPDQKVWAFSVDAFIATDTPTPAPLNSSAKVEITRVEYRQKKVGTSGSGVFEREIHYWVKNTGTIKAYYAVHMATISA